MEKCKVVDLSVFDIIDNYKKLTSLEKDVEDIIDLYKDYYELLLKVYNEKKLNKYLIKIKNDDIKVNQHVEGEDEEDIDEARKQVPASAIDFMISNCNFLLSKELFVLIHDLLLIGTSSQSMVGIREDDSYFVGSNKNENKKVSYYPLLHKDIDIAIEMFLNFYNDLTEQENLDKVVLPIIYNGLICTLQLFKDGNTRFGRLIQNVNFWKNLNNSIVPKSELPIIYATKQYRNSCVKSRALVKNIAINNDLDAWNDYILYNLNTIKLGLVNDSLTLKKKLKR